MPLVFAIIGFAVVVGALVIAPTFVLAVAGHGRTSLIVAFAVMIALIVDHLYNWDGIAYPNVLLAAFDFFFPASIVAALLGIGVGVRAWLRQQ
jgi:hypothetical protein